MSTARACSLCVTVGATRSLGIELIYCTSVGAGDGGERRPRKHVQCAGPANAARHAQAALAGRLRLPSLALLHRRARLHLEKNGLEETRLAAGMRSRWTKSSFCGTESYMTNHAKAPNGCVNVRCETLALLECLCPRVCGQPMVASLIWHKSFTCCAPPQAA